MPSKNQNSIKQFIIRAMALTITLCYIFGPLHVQVSNILHTISHNFNAPTYVLQHDADHNNEYIKHLNSGTALTNHQPTHQHQFLELLETIFNANGNNNNEGETTLNDFKIKKHIVLDTYAFVGNDDHIIIDSLFVFKGLIFENEYLNQLYRPPKV